MATNVLVICPSTVDATSFYRGMGPLAALRKEMDIDLVFTSEVTWPILATCDLIFMLRPYKDAHYKIAEMARNCNVPLWVDYDDDLFHVQADNPTFFLYGSEKIQKNVARIIAMADCVTVSTAALKKSFGQLNQNITVVPNAWNDIMFPRVIEPGAKQRNIAMWRGSPTHQKDIMSYSAQIELNEREGWQFAFMGYNPWFLQMKRENSVILIESMDVVDYFATLSKIRPRLMMVPLHNNGFNHCKSNIAWIEGSFAGAACLVPAFDEWQKPGALIYQEQEGFGYLLGAAMKGEIDLAKRAEDSWQYIESELRLTDVNNLRREVIESIL